MKISIIIPVYNTEKYIKRCLDSIVNQTHKDIEIIIINDGTPDHSGAICKSYSKRDSRIKYFTKKNGGLSSARNYGLLHATGEYTMFVDSDDWIELDTCEKIYNEIQHKKYDVILFSYFKNYGKKEVEKLIISTSKQTIEYNENQLRNRLLKRTIGLSGEELGHPEHMDSIVTAWSKMYKTSVIKNHEFIDTKEIGTEDALWNIEVLLDCKSALYMNICMYHYWKNNQSSLTMNNSNTIYYKWKNLNWRIKEILHKNNLGDVYIEAYYNRIALSVLGIGIVTARARMRYGDKIKFLSEVLNDPEFVESYRKLDFRYFGIKWKIFFFLAKNKMPRPLYGMLFFINKIVSK